MKEYVSKQWLINSFKMTKTDQVRVVEMFYYTFVIIIISSSRSSSTGLFVILEISLNNNINSVNIYITITLPLPVKKKKLLKNQHNTKRVIISFKTRISIH